MSERVLCADVEAAAEPAVELLPRTAHPHTLLRFRGRDITLRCARDL